ncbi:MAG TPA: PQQ-binding-like beta-propeller repeat protein, partial [Gemmatimonadales bacterium]
MGLASALLLAGVSPAQARPALALITLSKVAGPPTSRVTVQGSGFGASETIDLKFDVRFIATAQSDATGSFSKKITVPKAALPGNHLVKAKGESSGLFAQATFTVRTDWPTFHFGMDRTGYNPYENVLSAANVSQLVPKWTASLNGVVNTSPIIAGGVVYVGAQSTHSGTLYAIDAATGATIWSRDFTDCAIAPTVTNGIVYVATCLGDSVVALTAANGATLWEKVTGAGVFNAPAVSGGVAYFGSDDGSLYAIDAGSGQTVWTSPDGGAGIGAPTVVGGVVYHVAASGPRLVALDAQSGSILWSAPLPNFSENSAAVSGGNVYVGMANGPPYRGVSAYDAATGSLVWNQ